MYPKEPPWTNGFDPKEWDPDFIQNCQSFTSLSQCPHFICVETEFREKRGLSRFVRAEPRVGLRKPDIQRRCLLQ